MVASNDTPDHVYSSNDTPDHVYSAPPSSPSNSHRYPFAAAPDIIRSSQKDIYFQGLLLDQLSIILRKLYGARFLHTYTSEARTFTELLYLGLTTFIGNRTLGEEYCDIIQIETPAFSSPPSPAAPATSSAASSSPTSSASSSPASAPASASNWNPTSGGSPTPPLPPPPHLPPHPPRNPHVPLPPLRPPPLHLLLHRRPLPPQQPPLLPPPHLPPPPPALLPPPQLRSPRRPPRPANSRASIPPPPQHFPRPLATPSSAAGGRALVDGGVEVGLDAHAPSGENVLMEAPTPHVGRGRIEASTHTPALPAERARYDLKEPGLMGWVQGRAQRRCTLCLEEMREPSVTTCGHVFCWGCIKDWVREKPECPLCRQAVLGQHVLPLRG
ncbi:MAG: peroxisome biosynthesis (Peroxin-10) [Lasallia pustulata]|uniref:RING-type E3 ubiquitin transferase n=1 Tax=Lasallia pustulata TaxID=136370 RepID=A0A5M8PT52_9LECA|nr:MAG: peroxisome biosynthesis (Peroxin-10) [Lasallia pustulata]